MGFGLPVIDPTSFPNLQDWWQNCFDGGGIPAPIYQELWYSHFFETSPCSFQGAASGLPQTSMFALFDTLDLQGTPSTTLLDGHAVNDCTVTVSGPGQGVVNSCFPRLPGPNLSIVQPEFTAMCILKLDVTDPATSPMAFRWRGNDGNSDILIRMAGIGNDYLNLFVRSSNGQSISLTDTVVFTGSGYHIVCIQYSYTTKTGRLIIDGRVITGTNLLMDTFDYVPTSIGGTSVLINCGNAIPWTSIWLGQTGDLFWYDVALLSNANINSLGNNYFVNRYPTLTWTDI